jgi:hypothetical protein
LSNRCGEKWQKTREIISQVLEKCSDIAKTREIISLVLEKYSYIVKNQGNNFPGFREIILYSKKPGKYFPWF